MARDSAQRRLHVLVGVAVLAAAGAMAASVAAILDRDLPAPWPGLAALTVLVAVGGALNVRVRVRSTQHGVQWADAAVLVGLATLPVPWVVLATFAGVAAGKTLRRVPPLKTVFGAAKESVLAAAGGLVLLGLQSSPTPQIGALALAFAAMTVVDELLTVPVIAAAARVPVRDRWRQNWDARLLAALGRFIVAAVAVQVLRWQPQLLPALAVAVVIAHLWHERWVRTRAERQAWQRLSEATQAFTGLQLGQVLHTAVRQAAWLFSADAAEIQLWAEHPSRLVRGAEQVTFDGDPTAAAGGDSMRVYAVALWGQPRGLDVGALRLRFRGQVAISPREQAMLQHYAAALEVAIRNAVTHEQLSQTTAAHAHAAAHDALTGLANRRELPRLLQQAVADPGGLAVLMLDLRHFKEVNDTCGHLVGDQVLVEVAARLVAGAGDRAHVARFGGDEFIVVWTHPIRRDLRQHAEQMLAALAEPVEVDGMPVAVEANAGLTIVGHHEDSPDTAAGLTTRGRPADAASELLRRADAAMYRAKRTGQRLCVYRRLHEAPEPRRPGPDRQAAGPAGDRELALAFQPIVDLGTGAALAAETLVQGQRTRGDLEPRRFLSLLEHPHHLADYTAAMLDRALSALTMWQAAGHHLNVAMNISARSLMDQDLPRQVLEALDHHRVAPDRLCLELTEALILSQLETVERVLTQLHDIGVRLTLDEFGRGHNSSSLTLLSQIPVHQLKIDRSLVRALAGEAGHLAERQTNPAARARAVIRSVAELGRTLDLTIIADGVETEQQRRRLWELGCAAGQGTMFAAPAPAAGLLAALTHGVDHRPGTLATPLHDPGSATVIRMPVRPPPAG